MKHKEPNENKMLATPTKIVFNRTVTPHAIEMQQREKQTFNVMIIQPNLTSSVQTNINTASKLITTCSTSFQSPLLKKHTTALTCSNLIRTNTLEKKASNSQVLIPRRSREKDSDFRRKLTQEPENSIMRYVRVDSICKVYLKKGIKTLFEWQIECLGKKEVWEGRKNFVYSAPTSAGKTLVSEILMIHRYCQTQKKMIYVVPYVSLCFEKQRYFTELFASTPTVVTGFYQSKQIHSKFQIAVCTIEKANALINKLIQEQEINNVSMIVIDEIHMLTEEHRGYILELIICKLLYLNKNIQIVGMSATMPALDMYESWMKALTYQSTFRPIELKQYIVCNKKVMNAKGDAEREMKESNDVANIVELTREVGDEGKGVICFCSSKYRCVRMANDIVDRMIQKRMKPFNYNRDIDESRAELIEELKGNPFGIEETFLRTIPFGLAYHHSGVTNEEREIIEQAFRNGILTMIIATSTLAVGVNLPASRVIFDCPKIANGYLDVVKYQQMSGRAGRLGLDEKGESYMFCKENEMRRTKEMMESKIPRIEDGIGSNGVTKLAQSILEAMNDGIVKTEEDIDRYSRSSIYSMKTPNETQTFTQHNNENIKSAIDILVNNEMVEEKIVENERIFECTAFGLATVNGGIFIEDSIKVYESLNEARKGLNLDNDLHVLYLVSSINNMVDVKWGIFASKLEEMKDNERRVADALGIDATFVDYMENERKPKETEAMKAKLRKYRMFYCAVMLNQIINEKSLEEIAKEFDIGRGNLQQIQNNAGTSASMISQFCAQLQWTHLSAIFNGLVERLNHGVQQDLLDLVRIKGVKGIRARELFKHGFKTVEEVANSSVEAVYAVIHKLRPFKKLSPNSKNIDFSKQVDLTLSKNIVSNARELCGMNSPADKVNSVIMKGKGGINKEQMLQRSLSMNEMIDIVYINDICKAQQSGEITGLYDMIRNEKEMGVFVKIIEEKEKIVIERNGNRLFEDETIDGFSIGSFKKMYYVKCHKACGPHCRIYQDIIPLMYGQTTIRQTPFVVFDIKKVVRSLIGITNEPNGGMNINNIKDPLMEYWLAQGIDIDAINEDAIDVDITHLYQGYKEQIIRIIPSLQLKNFEEIDKTKEEESFILKYYDDIFQCCTKNLYSMAISRILSSEVAETKYHPFFKEVDMPLTLILARMETIGIGFDRTLCNSMRSQITIYLNIIAEKIYKECGYKLYIESNESISNYFFNILKIEYPGKQTTKYQSKRGVGYQINNYVLNKIKKHSRVAEWIIDYRSLKNIQRKVFEELERYSVYDEVSGMDRIHGFYSQISSATGRLAMGNPNLMNIPNVKHFESINQSINVRKCIIAQKGCLLLSCDYCQQEIKIFGFLSKDNGIIGQMKMNKDIFIYLASQWFKVDEFLVADHQRAKAKTLCYGILYGISKYSVAEELGIDVTEAEELMLGFKKEFPQLEQYVESIKAQSRQGFVSTLNKRTRKFFIPTTKSTGTGKSTEQKKIERKSVNTLIQGSAAEINKKVMVLLNNQILENNQDVRMILHLHDELIFEIKEEMVHLIAPKIKSIMETTFFNQIKLNIKMKIGSNWGEMLDFNC